MVENMENEVENPFTKVNRESVKHMNKAKERDSNLELYRIVVMLLMIAHHYTANSGLMNVIYESPINSRSLFYLVFGAWGKTGINCFVIITGYFMCRKSIFNEAGQISSSFILKWIRLFSEMIFYKIIIQIIFWICGYETVTLTGIMRLLLPIHNVEQNFTGCFLLFYFFIPFLCFFVQGLNEYQHRLLMYLLLFIYTVFGTLPKFSVSMNYVSWYIVLFIIGSYISLYPSTTLRGVLSLGINKNQCSEEDSVWNRKKLWGVMSIASIMTQVVSIYIMALFSSMFNQKIAYYFMQDCNSLFCVTTGISTFLFFKNTSIPYNRYINTIAASTFGVLQIHANSDTMRSFLWTDLFHNVDMYYWNSRFWFLYPIVVCFTIYIIATIIDYFRVKIFEKPWIKLVKSYMNICENTHDK